MPKCDRLNRPYANLHDLTKGDWIELDAGFACRPAGIAQIQQDRSSGSLYFPCNSGHHVLNGQMDPDGTLVGIYLYKHRPPTS